jgi:hypothetical protein
MKMDLAKVRIIKENFNKLVVFLNEEEISDIAIVLDRACDRLLSEAGE